MVEIRTIDESEAEQFLHLLCLVFNLDIDMARSVFSSEPMFDLHRKWCLFEDGEMRTILTTTPLIFGWGRAFGIAGVATRPEYRRRGYGQRILEHVLAHGKENGEPAALLFAHETKVYERVGFKMLDEVVRGRLVTDAEPGVGPVLTDEEIHGVYDAWAEADDYRLRRDALRWKYWSWVLRTCERANGGYICLEPGLCREAILEPSLDRWPLPEDTEWTGLASMTDRFAVPLKDKRHVLHVMGAGMSASPQMFMTDQF